MDQWWKSQDSDLYDNLSLNSGSIYIVVISEKKNITQ